MHLKAQHQPMNIRSKQVLLATEMDFNYQARNYMEVSV